MLKDKELNKEFDKKKKWLWKQLESEGFNGAFLEGWFQGLEEWYNTNYISRARVEEEIREKINKIDRAIKISSCEHNKPTDCLDVDCSREWIRSALRDCKSDFSDLLKAISKSDD